MQDPVLVGMGLLGGGAGSWWRQSYCTRRWETQSQGSKAMDPVNTPGSQDKYMQTRKVCPFRPRLQTRGHNLKLRNFRRAP